MQVKKCPCSKPCLKEEFFFEEGFQATIEGYKIVLKKAKQVQIELTDETFWGLIFNYENLQKFVNCKEGDTFLFMSANNTMNGQIVGKVYKGIMVENKFFKIISKES